MVKGGGQGELGWEASWMNCSQILRLNHMQISHEEGTETSVRSQKKRKASW